MSELIAIYVLWLRAMKRFIRAKSQLVGTIVLPLFFLFSFGFGFSGMRVPGVNVSVDYLPFLIPGIIGMGLMFRSTIVGFSVLWDREFGFLKEIMVAPVRRVSIVIGRTIGGVTTSLLQGLLILILTLFVGFTIPSLESFILMLVFMILISTTFIGLGLIFASIIKDPQGFGLIMNIIILPLFFLSGTFYPLSNLPWFVQIFSLYWPTYLWCWWLKRSVNWCFNSAYNNWYTGFGINFRVNGINWYFIIWAQWKRLIALLRLINLTHIL